MVDSTSRKSLRIIHTARTEDEINKAAKNGFFPLVKTVTSSPEIRSKFAIFQDPISGKISVIGDYRAHGAGNKIIDFTYYYPHNWPSPFAAYLIPRELKKGEHVILEDLIEDLIGECWGQGDVYRLKSCEAIWNAEDFIILYDESSVVECIG